MEVGAYEIDRALRFKENFVEAFKDLNYEGVDKLLKKVNSFKNPLDFWEFIKDSNLSDLKIYYDIKKGLVTFGNDEENFKEDLMELGII